VHVAIDDHSRIGLSAIHPNEQARSVVRFLFEALRYYARLGPGRSSVRKPTTHSPANSKI
jgi:hypothetical protein